MLYLISHQEENGQHHFLAYDKSAKTDTLRKSMLHRRDFSHPTGYSPENVVGVATFTRNHDGSYSSAWTYVDDNWRRQSVYY